ncbi:dnaJ protein subfamily C member 13 [Pelomyxa schiedti]|nr:dnaJ protein subfamily C member 13 [Pelomyxa schiedti]
MSKPMVPPPAPASSTPATAPAPAPSKKDKEEPASTAAKANLPLIASISTRHAIKKKGWHGGWYQRSVCLTPTVIITLNPATMEVTNTWEYRDVLSIVPVTGKTEEEFQLTIRKPNNKPDKMSFSSPYRAQVLSDFARMIYAVTSKNAKEIPPELRFPAQKLKRSSERKEIQLAVMPWGLCQVNPITGAPFATYHTVNIDKIAIISDIPGGFAVFYGHQDKRIYVFICPERDRLLDTMAKSALSVLGIKLASGKGETGVHMVTLDYVQELIHAIEGDDQVAQTLVEFQVLKHSPRRHPDPQQRIITLSDKWLVERRPNTFAVATMRTLESISWLIRVPDDPQALSVYYRDATEARYSSTARDNLLSCIIDCAKSAGNKDIFVASAPLRRGMRQTPFFIPLDLETETNILKSLASFSPAECSSPTDPTGKEYLNMLLATFNANVPASGFQFLDAGRNYRVIIQALTNILTHAKPTTSMLHAVRRFIISRAGFESFSDVQAVRDKLLTLLQQALQSTDEMASYASLEIMVALLLPHFDQGDNRAVETTNKKYLLSCEPLMMAFMNLYTAYIKKGTGALSLMVCMEFFTACLCEPFSDTTEGAQFDWLIQNIAKIGRDYFKLFHQNHCISVVRSAGMVMRTIIEEGDVTDIVSVMQTSALVEGAILRHLHAALFSKATNQRHVIFKDLSCHLVSLWTSAHEDAEIMLKRIFPVSLLAYLDATEEPPEEKEILSDAKMAQKQVQFSVKTWLNQWQSHRQIPKRKPVPLRQKRPPWAGAKKNWPMFFFQFKQDHARPDLIWNNLTRDELREALESELRVFKQQQELTHDGFVSWNHQEFIVPYDCLSREVCVAGFYLRLLLNMQPGQKARSLAKGEAAEFFDMLFHRCLLEQEIELKALCIQAIATVYKFYKAEIPQFRDLPHIVTMLRQTSNRLIRDRLLQFIYVLVENEDNAKSFIDCGGIYTMVELITLVHLQAEHIVAPLKGNLITCGKEMLEGEWYYSRVIPGEKHDDGTQDPPKKERVGPLNISEIGTLREKGEIDNATLCWAQGMEDWKPLQDIYQLKWCFLANGNGLFDYYQLGAIVLDILTQLCSLYPIRDKDGGIIRPIPRPKRQLSSPQLLPHIVQVLLTADPTLIDKTAILLRVLMEDNAGAVLKLYLTGVFYFIMQYGGSNFMSIAELLKSVHMVQRFKEEESSGDIAARSILGGIVPSAMIHLLERRGEAEFTKVFLGNFDTPEAIWNRDMRMFLIEKISVHMGNFPQRLNTNIKAVYSFVPMAPVVYKQLAGELFCHHYYLRNLCDLTRFPLWPIEKEVELLQAVLVAWNKEADKKPPTMTDDEAISALELSNKEFSEEELRRAYFRKAAKFHPDKNPEGRPIFEKIHEAYQLLSQSRSADSGRNNVNLILKVQSILYTRFRNELAPFKYAGYGLLLHNTTHALDIDDKELLLLASELCLRTIQSTTLNAEELRRQNGMEILSNALSKSIESVTQQSSPKAIACEICSYLVRTFSSASAYEKCREKIVENEQILNNVCYCLKLNNIPYLVEAALECVCSFALDTNLQQMMFDRNVVLLVLPHLLHYDFTLNAAGVDTTENNSQNMLNILAGLGILAIGRLGGFDPAAPVHEEMQACILALLTPSIANQICKRSMEDVLKDINSNVETPGCIWNNATRQELVSFLESHLSSASGLDFSPAEAKNFKYLSLESELHIYNVYIRPYNEQPKTHGQVDDPRAFCAALLSFLAESLPLLKEKPAADAPPEDPAVTNYKKLVGNATITSTALLNLLRAVKGLELIVAIREHLNTLFSLIALVASNDLTKEILGVVSHLTKNLECVNSIAEAGVIGLFLPVIFNSPACQVASITVLHSLISNSKIVNAVINQGGILYLLRAFCAATDRGGDNSARVQAALTIAKMTVDQVQGSRSMLALLKFIPSAFITAMKQDGETAVHIFDAIHENPELIWNASTRTQLRDVIEKLSTEFVAKQLVNPHERWSITDDFQVKFDETKDELQIGGVFIRLFLKNPTWALSNPKSFVEALLSKYIELYTKLPENNPAIEDLLKTVTNATVALLQAQPAMCDHGAKTGHLAKIFQLVGGPIKHASAAGIIYQMSGSTLCVEAMVSFPSIKPLVDLMQARPSTAPVVVEALERMLKKNVCKLVECLVKQLLDCHAEVFLLSILEGTLDSMLSSDAAQVKARVVTALQSALTDATHGIHLRGILEKSTVWSNYSGQRHDLFLAGTQVVGLLTGGPSPVMGLLTDTAHAAPLSDTPPDLI